MDTDHTLEEWRSVVGYEGVYEVSSLGRVRSVRKGWSSRILRTHIGTPGYPQLNLCNGRRARASVHRLVAAAFIGPCPIGHDVNHISGIKTDNRPENLEYLSRSENQKHAVSIGIAGCGRKISDDQAGIILGMIDAGITQREIALQFGVSRPLISIIKSRKVQYAKRVQKNYGI